MLLRAFFRFEKSSVANQWQRRVNVGSAPIVGDRVDSYLHSRVAENGVTSSSLRSIAELSALLLKQHRCDRFLPALLEASGIKRPGEVCRGLFRHQEPRAERRCCYRRDSGRIACRDCVLHIKIYDCKTSRFHTDKIVNAIDRVSGAADSR